jgi:hypothetical protein
LPGGIAAAAPETRKPPISAAPAKFFETLSDRYRNAGDYVLLHFVSLAGLRRAK